MKKNKSLRLILLGFIIWLVPFIASFGFYDRTGNLNVSYGFFKCVMIVVSSITGMYVLSYHLNLVRSNYFKEGCIAGITWLIMNLLLDIVILIPMAGISFKEYLANIGFGYLQIPVICISVGMILQRKITV
jgi:hypothetical protein